MPAQSRVFVLPLGVRVTLSVNSDSADMQLSAVKGAVADIRPLLARMAGVLRSEIRQTFADGGTPGNRWQRLKPSTIAEKAIAGLPSMTGKGNIPRRLIQRGGFSPANILMRTGALRDSWGVKGDPNHIEELDGKAGTVRIGSKLPYAAFHQGGTRPYTIEAKGGALAFTVAGGAMIFRKKVHHPGLPARAVTISARGIARLRDAAQDYLKAASAPGGVATFAAQSSD